ncbi:MAG: sulfite exporter TauE/SafE family protein, partial [Bacteroidota bacterium]
MVAVLYSSVGHGGASGYLALMALWGFALETMKPWALVLNICVSLIATIQFLRSEKPNWKLFLFLIAGSIPAAYIGASIHIEQELYKKILGGLVLFQSVRLFMLLPIKTTFDTEAPKPLLALLVGAAIGLLSGMIGIG